MSGHTHKELKISTVEQAVVEIRKIRSANHWAPAKGDSSYGTGGSNVFCGAVYEDGSVRDDFYPCHQPIKSYQNAKILWSCFGSRVGAVATNRFHKWLTQESPWAKIGCVPEEVADFNLKEGFIFTGLDKIPANKLHNFLVASRMAAEWPNYIDAWYDLCIKHDLDPTFAFLLLTVFHPLNDHGRTKTPFDVNTVSCLAFMDKYDWPLDMARCGEEYLVNFLKASPVGVSSEMFFPHAKTEPVNTLWGPMFDSKSKDKTYVHKLAEMYGSKFGKPRAAGHVFRKYELSPSQQTEADKSDHKWSFDSKAVVEIAQLEQKRIFEEFKIDRD